jgi:ribosomal protein S18 acetylase RimI-like enzyme
MKNEEIKIRNAKENDILKLTKMKMTYEKEERSFAPKNDFWRMYINFKKQKEDITEDMKDKNSFFIIAENKLKEIIGFSTAFLEYDYQNKPTCKLAEIYVIPRYRGKKIATLLMNKIFEIGKRKRLILNVSPNNKHAINIYKKKGFELAYTCLGKKINKYLKVKNYKNYHIYNTLSNKLSKEEKKFIKIHDLLMYKKLPIRDYSISFILNDNSQFTGFVITATNQMPDIMKTKTICKIESIFGIENKIYKRLFNNIFYNAKNQTKYFTIHILSDNIEKLALFKKLGFGKSYLCFKKEIN